jgi:hypothetical protein
MAGISGDTGLEVGAMAATPTGLAEAVLRQQVEIFGRSGISLDSLWRAVGEPAGHEPRSWAVLAEPLLRGFAGYLANLGRRRILPTADPTVLWTWDAESSEPWRTGDLMSNAWVARLYASYLDSQVSTDAAL